MTDDQISRLPQTGVVLDLDVAERDPNEADRPPYAVNVAGKVVVLVDPDEVDWVELADVHIPADMLRLVMSDEDFRHLTSAKIPTWKFKRLLEGYYEHYDVEDKIRAAKRQASLRGL